MTIRNSLIDTEIQSRSVGCRQTERDRTRSRIMTADAADSEFQGWPNNTAQNFNIFPWSALQYKSNLRLVLTLRHLSVIRHNHTNARRSGMNSKGREGFSSSLRPTGSKTYSASLPTRRDLYSQAQQPHATVKLKPNSAHRWRAQLPFPPHPFTTQY